MIGGTRISGVLSMELAIFAAMAQAFAGDESIFTWSWLGYAVATDDESFAEAVGAVF